VTTNGSGFHTGSLTEPSGTHANLGFRIGRPHSGPTPAA
jgi:hypothetical protein